MKKILSKWYWVVIGGFILFAAAVYILLGEDSVIAVHDNLDLFVPQYKMMKDTGTFFAHDASVPFLANLSRDYLPSEFNLYTMVFMVFPEFAAYIICYFLKIAIGLTGCILLAKDVLREKFGDYESIIWLTSFAFSILNLFPNFGIAFAAIPLLVFIMHRIITKPKWYWFLALFCYPFLSYFSYLGIFFIGYLCLYFVYKWIASRKFPWAVLLAIPTLSLGYVAFEYRLFNQMLFLDIESIRTTMVQASLGWKDIFAMMWEGFAIGDMHTESVHIYFVMPVCLLYFLIQTICYIRKGQIRAIFTDYFNGVLLFIIFNSAIYGLYYWEPLRNLFEMILPPLKGFEFHRMEFVNPFLWYLAFFIVLKRVYDKAPKFKWLANVAALVAIFIIVLNGGRYNDLYHTCLDQYYQLVKGTHTNELTYKEFYSVDLFEKAKEDIGYSGEWSVAYGFYPAVLEYNDIHTLDGYLGYYPEYYKQDFRKIIAPSLERIPESASYYDGWGARCYMYSGTYTSNTNAYRNYEYTDEDLYIDLDAFKDYLGRYIFSRVKINNADEAGFDLVNVYTDESSPYTLYVYRTKSWYKEKTHADVPYEERSMDYDTATLDGLLKVMEDMATAAIKIDAKSVDDDYTLMEEDRTILSDESVSEEGWTVMPTEADLELMDRYYEEALSEIKKLVSASNISQIEYYKDVNDEEIISVKDALYELSIDYSDRYCQVLRTLANSPYEEFLEEKLSTACVDELMEYEDMTEEEKDREIRKQSLQTEYSQAAGENYYFEYDGRVYDFENLDEETADLDQDDLLTVYKGLYEEKGKVLGEIYKELVSLYHEEALEQGYESYADYVYEQIYPRDYTVEDVKKLCKAVKNQCWGYYSIASSRMENLYYLDPGYFTEDDTETFNTLRSVFGDIDSELTGPLDHLLKNNLYDMKSRESKAECGFTLDLPSYGDAYIFDSPYEGSSDIYTYVHEYGHYAQAYYANENIMTSVTNIDTAEIHSQGLEMLSTSHYRDIYGEETGDYLEAQNVYNMMDAVYTACMYSEFEIYSFEHPEATVEDLAFEFGCIFEDYGFDYDLGFDEGLYFWCDVSHFFESPCYYISYATSALAALDIYTMALEDEESARNKYMQFTALSSNWLIRESLDYVGLPDIFDRGVPRKIFKKALKSIKNIEEKYEETDG